MIRPVSFDAYVASLPAGRVHATLLEPGRHTIPSPPAFFFGNVPASLSDYFFSRTGFGPVTCHTLADACVSLDGVLVGPGLAVVNDATNHLAGHVDHLIGRLTDAPPPGRRRLDEQVVLMCGPGYTVFGHWLVDLLPRLFVLEAAGFDVCALSYLLPASTPGFAINLLETLGIGREQLRFFDEDSDVVEVGELLIPSNLRSGDRFHPMMAGAARVLAHMAAPDAAPHPLGDRLYVSRQSADNSRQTTNRARLEAIAVEHGLTVVHPETLTFREQVQLFSSARELAGEYGSGLHSCMFGGADMTVMAVRSTSRHPGLIQSGLCEVLGQRVGYVLADTPFAAFEQVMTVDEMQFRHGLDTLERLSRPSTASFAPRPLPSTNAVTAPERIALPHGNPVHAIVSPAFAYPAPDTVHPELIDPRISGIMAETWSRAHPAEAVEFRVLRDVFVVGEGLVFDRQRRLVDPSVTQTPPQAVDAAYQRLCEAQAAGTVVDIPQPAVLCGKAGLNNYGHWLAEMLPLAAMSLPWIGLDRGWQVLVPKVFPWMAEVVASSLDLLGVTGERRVLLTGEPCHVSELVFVTGLTRHGQYFSPLVIEAMDRVAAPIPAGPYPRVWMTRAGEDRALLDEDACNQRIAEAGWTVVRPRQLTFAEQVSLAKGAHHMAGVNGAGLANHVFMRPGGTLTSFVPSTMPDVFYWQLAGHRKLRYREIRSGLQRGDGPASGWDAPLTIGIDEVLSHLAQAVSD